MQDLVQPTHAGVENNYDYYVFTAVTVTHHYREAVNMLGLKRKTSMFPHPHFSIT